MLKTDIDPAERQCSKPLTCPLSQVNAGMHVRIHSLTAPADVTRRLREIGLVERQVITLILRQANFICQVCNVRLALSAELARMIIVQPLPNPLGRQKHW